METALPRQLSMQSRRKQGKLKQVVGGLLTQLENAKKYAIGAFNENNKEDQLELTFKEIEIELGNLMNLFPSIMHWEGKLIEKLRALEKQIDDDFFKEHDNIEEIFHRLKLINDSVVSIKLLLLETESKLMDGQSTEPFQGHQAPFQDGGKQQTMSGEQHLEKEWFASKTFLKFEKCFDCLESYQLKACYLWLSVFPESSIIKKKPLIYWWIGEGLISKTNGRTAEEVGEDVFQELITEGFLIPERDHRPCNVNSCVVHPSARRALMFVAKSLHFLDFDPRWNNPVNGYGRAFLFPEDSDSIDEKTLTVFNLTKQYLGSTEDWLSKLNRVQVLQLGRWQKDVKHHIELENEDWTFDQKMKKKTETEVYLNGLGTQTSLRYLSLRGISRMTALPPSVAKLSSLVILDLSDCQVLEKIPFAVSSLENLTHLDLSECYLLESMPKGIEKLSSIQVLKGFVIGNVRKDPCKLSDLVRLEQLRKLSIRIGSEASGEGDFSNFKNFKALQILVISWSGANVSMNSFTVPPKLKKLELRCSPIEEAPEWLGPDQLKSLEKLYIRGGKLRTLHHRTRGENHWGVKILILKYLKAFNHQLQELLVMFPEVEYLEKVQCNGFPDIIWRKAQEKKAIN